jgi:hypothetical protein
VALHRGVVLEETVDAHRHLVDLVSTRTEFEFHEQLESVGNCIAERGRLDNGRKEG